MTARIHADHSRRGQASLEATFALLGAVLLLLAGFRIFLWMSERLISRQREFQRTRVEAIDRGRTAGVPAYEPTQPLDLFGERR